MYALKVLVVLVVILAALGGLLALIININWVLPALFIGGVGFVAVCWAMMIVDTVWK